MYEVTFEFDRCIRHRWRGPAPSPIHAFAFAEAAEQCTDWLQQGRGYTITIKEMR